MTWQLRSVLRRLPVWEKTPELVSEEQEDSLTVLSSLLSMVLDLVTRAAVLVVILLLSCQVGSLLGLLTRRESPILGILLVCLLVLRLGRDW